MYTNEAISELKRLKFENIIWIVFAFLCIANIFGDVNSEEYLITDNQKYKDNSNKIFEITLIITFFIYVYFFTRNYKAYLKASNEDKNLFLIKVLGSSFLIAGILCLIYFQTRETNFTGSPAL